MYSTTLKLYFIMFLMLTTCISSFPWDANGECTPGHVQNEHLDRHYYTGTSYDTCTDDLCKKFKVTRIFFFYSN